MKDEGLLKILAQKPRSVSQLSKDLGVRREFLAGYLEALRDRNIIKRVLVGRSYVYMPYDRENNNPKSIFMTGDSGPAVAKMSEEEEE